MQRAPASPWLAVPIGCLLGAVAGSILAALWLTFALGIDPAEFDARLLWSAPGWRRSAHVEAFRIAYGIAVGAALAFASAAALLGLRRPATDYGQARWQTRPEMKRNGMLGRPGDGFIVGKLGAPRSRAPFIISGNQQQPHVLMVAPTRAGKGVGFVVPNLLSFAGSAVVLDVKGELFELTAGARALLGDEAWRFSPFDWQHGTHRFNPLSRVAKLPDHEARFTEAQNLAHRFLAPPERAGDPFHPAGVKIFVAAVLTALERGTVTLGAVNAIVNGGSDKNAQYRDYADQAKHPHLRELWLGAASAADRLLTSNIQALMSAGFGAWDNPAVRAATEASDFELASFRERRQVLYLSVAEDHVQALAPVLRLFFAELMAEMRGVTRQGGGRWPVMLMIDEFQALGRMSYLERAIHTVAADGVSVAMIAQSVAALDALYGREGREALESAAGVRLFIAPRDPRTAREVSGIVGKTTREAVARNWGRTRELFGGARSHTARLEERPLLSETDARMLDPERVVIVAGSQQPILAHRVKYYEDRAFQDAVAVARARPLPWPEREAAPPAEPSHPEGLNRIVAESDGATEALAGGSVPAASSTCAAETEMEGRLRQTSAETTSGAHPNIRRSRLRSAGIDLPRQQPPAPERFDVDAEAPATWSDVLKPSLP